MSTYLSGHLLKALRPVLGLGAVLALVGVGVSPAAADNSQLYVFGNLVYPAIVPANGVATEVDLGVSAFDMSGSTTSMAHNVIVTITMPGVDGPLSGTVSAPGCTTAGAMTTCLIPSLGPLAGVSIPLMLTAQPGTPDGTQAPVTVAVSASDASGQPATPQQVTIADGPNLVAVPSQLQPMLQLDRGQRGILGPLSVTNTGTQPAQGVTIVLVGSYYLPWRADFSNCQRSADGIVSVCYINDVIQPGQTYQIVNLPEFRLRDDTPYTGPDTPVDGVGASFFPGDDVLAQENYTGPYTGGDGGPLTLVRIVGTGVPQTTTQSVQQQNFVNDTANMFGQEFRAVDGLTTDLAAVGDRAVAIRTAPATVQVGVRDVGNATLMDHAGFGIAHVRFTVPTGATVTTAPRECTPVTTDGSFPTPGAPGYGVYDCQAGHFLKTHTSQTFAFQLMLAAGIKKTTGSATIYAGDGGYGPMPFPTGWDTDPSNDTAPVTVTAG